MLLAEDHDDSRQIYSLILRHYGYEVFEAVTGVQAVELARAGCPALILMDIGLPLLDGWEASKLIKADPLTRRVPIIAFSARVDSTADLGGAQPVFDGFIQKPVSPLQLVSRVAAYLELLGGAAGFEIGRAHV